MGFYQGKRFFTIFSASYNIKLLFNKKIFFCLIRVNVTFFYFVFFLYVLQYVLCAVLAFGFKLTQSPLFLVMIQILSLARSRRETPSHSPRLPPMLPTRSEGKYLY